VKMIIIISVRLIILMTAVMTCESQSDSDDVCFEGKF
jgi:hypothetical protein